MDKHTALQVRGVYHICRKFYCRS